MTCSQMADKSKSSRARRRRRARSLLRRESSLEDAAIMPALFYQMMDRVDLFDLLPSESEPPAKPAPASPPSTAV